MHRDLLLGPRPTIPIGLQDRFKSRDQHEDWHCWDPSSHPQHLDPQLAAPLPIDGSGQNLDTASQRGNLAQSLALRESCPCSLFRGRHGTLLFVGDIGNNDLDKHVRIPVT